MIATMILGVWVASVACVAAWAAIRSRAPAAESSRDPSPVLLLRPCAGDEDGLVERLAASSVAGQGARVRLLVGSIDDGAAFSVARAARELADDGIDARIVVTDARAPNRKADQIARALDREPRDTIAELVVVADSDVHLGREALAAVVQPVARGLADACWAPPIETRPATPADRVSAAILGASLHSFPLLAALDPQGMVGKLVCVRRGALDRIGGFAALTSYLGEDMELARRMTANGLRVRVAGRTVESHARGRSLSAVVARYARWIAVVRAQRPHLLPSYPLLFACAPLQIAAAMVATAIDGPIALSVGALSLVVRVATALVARARSRAQVSLVDSIAGDVVLLSAFVQSVSSSRVAWRGVSLRARGDRIALSEPR